MPCPMVKNTAQSAEGSRVEKQCNGDNKLAQKATAKSPAATMAFLTFSFAFGKAETKEKMYEKNFTKKLLCILRGSFLAAKRRQREPLVCPIAVYAAATRLNFGVYPFSAFISK
jgi:hypothetical protein